MTRPERHPVSLAGLKLVTAGAELGLVRSGDDRPTGTRSGPPVEKPDPEPPAGG